MSAPDLSSRFPCWHLLQPETRRILGELEGWLEMATTSKAVSLPKLIRQRPKLCACGCRRRLPPTQSFGGSQRRYYSRTCRLRAAQVRQQEARRLRSHGDPLRKLNHTA